MAHDGLREKFNEKGVCHAADLCARMLVIIEAGTDRELEVLLREAVRFMADEVLCDRPTYSPLAMRIVEHVAIENEIATLANGIHLDLVVKWETWVGLVKERAMVSDDPETIHDHLRSMWLYREKVEILSDFARWLGTGRSIATDNPNRVASSQ